MAATLDGLVDELRDFARELDAAVWSSGLQGHFTSTRRSRAEQTRLYRAYVAGRHPYPVAAPGFSPHEYGEAFDYVVTPDQYQANVGQTWESWGGKWGGAADVVHFELPGASERANARGLEEQGQPAETGSQIAHFIDSWFLSVGPWWAGVSASSLIKKAVAIERSLGFDAALDWFYRHVMTEVK
jgi:hypothetical protein